MNSATLPTLPRKTSGRPMLALVVGLLALPFVIAGGLYFLGWQPARTGNYGQLLDPPVPLPATGLRRPDGSPLASADLQGKWLLLLSGTGACNSECAQRIDEMRRIQVSLNKEMGRLRRVVLTDLPDDPQLAAARPFDQCAQRADFLFRRHQRGEAGAQDAVHTADRQHGLAAPGIGSRAHAGTTAPLLSSCRV